MLLAFIGCLSKQVSRIAFTYVDSNFAPMKWKRPDPPRSPSRQGLSPSPVYRHLTGLSSDCSKPLPGVEFKLIPLSHLPAFSGYIGQVNVTPMAAVSDPLVNFRGKTKISYFPQKIENAVPDQGRIWPFKHPGLWQTTVSTTGRGPFSQFCFMVQSRATRKEIRRAIPIAPSRKDFQFVSIRTEPSMREPDDELPFYPHRIRLGHKGQPRTCW